MRASVSDESNGPKVDSKRRNVLEINRRYLPLKLLYFFFMAGECCNTMYYSVFLKHLGMSAEQAGIIWTLQTVISVVSPLFIGALTDKTGRPKVVLMVLLLSAGLTYAGLYFVPQEKFVLKQILPVNQSEIISAGNNSFCWTLVCNSTAPACYLSDRTTLKRSSFPNASELSFLQCREHAHHTSTNIGLLRTTSSPSEIGRHVSNGLHTTLSQLDYSTSSSDEVFRNRVCSFRSLQFSNRSIALSLSEEESGLLGSLAERGTLHVARASDVEKICYGNVTIKDSKLISRYSYNDVDEYGLTFWTATVLSALMSFAIVGVYPVIDATVLEVLGERDRHKLGLQRVWASVGYGVTALMLGYLRDVSVTDEGGILTGNGEFLSMFLGALICWTCAAAVSSILPVKNEEPTEKVKWKDVKTVLGRHKTIAFFAILFFYGFDTALQEIYLFWLAEGKLNAPSLVLGTSSSVGAFMDIPFCLAAGFFITKFGHSALLCFGMAAFAARITAVALVVDPWHLVGTESLRGITWGLTWVVICSYTSKISPKGLENSTMGLMQGYLWGGAHGVGSLVGGVIYQSLGGDFLFLSCGIATAIATIIFGIYSICSRGQPHKKDADRQISGDEMIRLERIHSGDGEDDLGSESTRWTK